MALDPAIIKAVQEAGFQVWMRRPTDDHMLFVGRQLRAVPEHDGENIGYLEFSRMRGLCISTVHKPNPTSGAGFSVGEFLALDHDFKGTLVGAFILAPHWAASSHAISARKYKNMADYRAADAFNAAYSLVEDVL